MNAAPTSAPDPVPAANPAATPAIPIADTAGPALVTDPNLESPDDFYEALIEAHRDCTDAQSQALNARLILLLANHIGRQAVLVQALAAARSSEGRP